MFAHRSCVIPFTMFPYSEQVQDIELYGTMLEMIRMLNELIQANEMVFMNFWYVDHYGASFGDDIDAKMNYFKHIKGYSMYIDYKQKIWCIVVINYFSKA